MSSNRIHAAWFGLHFFLLTAVCLAGIFWLIAQGATILPSACNEYARKAELGATWCLGKEAGPSNPLREVLVKMLAFSVWREHPNVKKLRATFGLVNPPSITEFEQGKMETFRPMFSFDFSLRDEQKQ